MDQVTVSRELLRQAIDWFHCHKDKSMSRNNSEQLADEVSEALRTALEQPAVEPVACLVRYRSLRTSANTAFDGRDHYAEWTQWVPHTIEYGRAVTDPARNSQGGGAIFEMQPLYTAQQPRKAVRLTDDEKLRIALDCNMRVRTGSGAVKYANAVEDAFIAKNRMTE